MANLYGYNSIPAHYDFINSYNAGMSPSVIHVNDTSLVLLFEKYLIEEALSVFEWSGLPEKWDQNFFKYVLFLCGHIGILNTDKYGVICMNGQPFGRGLYYQPVKYVISNPLLRGIQQPEIGKECAVIKLQPNWTGIYDLVSFYGSMMALCAESAGINLVNSKLAYVFMAKNKAQAESMKKLYDNIHSGDPAVFADEKLFDAEGNPKWVMFNQNLKNTYIAPEIMADMHRWKNLFLTEIGIPNANYEKSERLITNEVNANNTETLSKAELWLETMEHDIRKANELFGLNIGVKLRWKEGGLQNEQYDLNPGSV